MAGLFDEHFKSPQGLLSSALAKSNGADSNISPLARALLPARQPAPMGFSGYTPEIPDADWEARQQAEMAHLNSISAMAPRGIPWQQWRPSQNIEDRRGENFQPAVPGDVGARMLLDGSILMPDGRRWFPK